MKRIYTSLCALMLCGGITNAQSSFIDENFEGGIPANWSQQSNASDGGFLNGTAENLSSNSFAIPDNGGNIVATNDDDCNCDKAEEYLITPSMDFSGSSALFLEADVYYIAGTYQGNSEHAEIVYSTDGGSQWNHLVMIGGDADGWQHIAADISSLAGNSNVMIAFLYQDNGGWLYGLGVDNVAIYEPLGNNVGLTSLEVDQFGAVEANVNISGTFTNKGTNTVTSLKVSWTDDNNNTFDQVISNLNVAPLSSAQFSHDDKFEIPSVGTHGITVTIADPNGNTDEDLSDNTLSGAISGLSFIPSRNVVVEEGTGTWCGWCPRGTVGLAYMEETYHDSFIGIAVHNGDPMVVPEYDNNLGVGGYPSGHVDRFFLDTDPSSANLEDLYTQRMAMTPMAEVSNDILYDDETRVAQITVKARFAAAVSGADLRLNCVITENGVTGTESGYAQANYYSFQSQNLPLVGAGKDWQQEPSTIPASEMVYDHVAIAILGGYDGTTGSVPANVEVDGEVTASYAYTFPDGVPYKNYHVVGMLIDQNTGEIVNAVKSELTYVATGIEENANDFSFSIYPNPSTDVTYVNVELNESKDVQLQVTNVLGQQMFNQTFKNMNGSQVLPFTNDGLEAGIYLFTLTVDGKQQTERVIIR